MSREIRRVAEGFDWPLNKVWQGYLMPAEIRGHPCRGENCDNGMTIVAGYIDHIAHLLLMLDDDLDSQARGQQIHPWLAAIPCSSGKRVRADARELGTGLAGREAGFLGHDAIDRWAATQKIIQAAGLPEGWGTCPDCKGSAWAYDDEEQERAAENWEPTEPPEGDWWQIWETVSEGSPVTPAFGTAEELAAHVSGDDPSKYAGTLAWITGPGWAPSMISTGSTLRTADDIITSWPLEGRES